MTSDVKKLSIGFALREAWAGLKNNLPFFLLSALVFIGAELLHAYFMGNYEALIDGNVNAQPTGRSTFVYFLTSVLHALFLLIFLLGLVRASLSVIRGGKAALSDFASTPRQLWNYLLGSILYYLILFAGLFLLIVPGIIWGLRYSLYSYQIVDKNAEAMQSLTLSGQTTYGAKWDLMGYFLVIKTLSLAAIFTLGIGIFIVLPLSFLATASLYNTLTKEV